MNVLEEKPERAKENRVGLLGSQARSWPSGAELELQAREELEQANMNPEQ
jgi:hypothetical protein